MTFSYSPQTAAGKVRLLCTDRDEAHAIFSDEEIDVFLTLNDSDTLLAAAMALDQIAASQVLILKYIEINGLKTDGSKVASALHTQAEALRTQAALNAESGAVDVIGGVGPQGVC